LTTSVWSTFGAETIRRAHKLFPPARNSASLIRPLLAGCSLIIWRVVQKVLIEVDGSRDRYWTQLQVLGHFVDDSESEGLYTRIDCKHFDSLGDCIIPLPVSSRKTYLRVGDVQLSVDACRAAKRQTWTLRQRAAFGLNPDAGERDGDRRAQGEKGSRMEGRKGGLQQIWSVGSVSPGSLRGTCSDA